MKLFFRLSIYGELLRELLRSAKNESILLICSQKFTFWI